MGIFFRVGSKLTIAEDSRTFLVAFPGFDISKVPAARDKGIAAAAKKKGGQPHSDGPFKPESQKLMKEEIKGSLRRNIKGIEDAFDVIFKEMWPGFNLNKRAIKLKEPELKSEQKSYRIVPKVGVPVPPMIPETVA